MSVRQTEGGFWDRERLPRPGWRKRGKLHYVRLPIHKPTEFDPIEVFVEADRIVFVEDRADGTSTVGLSDQACWRVAVSAEDVFRLMEGLRLS